MTWSLALGLLMLVATGGRGRAAVVVAVAADPERAAGGRPYGHPGIRLQAEVVEVVGQRKLLAWTIPGLAHAFAFWGFCVLGLTIVEAFGALVDRSFSIPVIDGWAWIPFVEDFFAVMVLVALAVFTVIRIVQNPHKLGRASRFYGSHTGAAWLVLFMIFNVIWTLLLYRGAQINTGNFPYPTQWAFASNWVAGHPAVARSRPTRPSRPSACC